MQNKTNHPETDVIHAGYKPETLTGAVMPPIYATSTFAQYAPGQHKGYEYSRTKNPTRFVYEESIAKLEGGIKGFAFASGMAAISTIIEMLSANSNIIATTDLYGGTYRLFDKVKKHSANLNVTFSDFAKSDDIVQLIKPETQMLWIETPTNPMLNLIDLEKIAQIAKQHNLISVVDNTFATPILQRPLEFGIDIVVHSATKYLGGHSDTISGAVTTNKPELAEKLEFLQNSTGAIASPFDSFLVIRGIKTLALRMQRHSENASELANWLTTIPKINRVIYPGLKTHPQHDLAQKQMHAAGGMLSIELNASLSETINYLKKFKLFTLAESLGGVESLIEHPATMTHASIPAENRNQLGISDSLIRLSVGIEHIDDLKKDIEYALNL